MEAPLVWEPLPLHADRVRPCRDSSVNLAQSFNMGTSRRLPRVWLDGVLLYLAFMGCLRPARDVPSSRATPLGTVHDPTGHTISRRGEADVVGLRNVPGS